MKIYVTGGAGLVGSNLLKVGVERHGASVFATQHHCQADPWPGVQWSPVDICDRKQVLASVRAFEPQAIVHCAVVMDLLRIYRNRELGWQSYVQATRHYVEAANEVGAKLILISSDWVFDGTQSLADEATPPNPINYYGVLKLVAETIVAEAGDDWAVARVAGVNGVHWARPELELGQNAGFGNLALAAATSLSQGQPFTVWQGAVNMQGTPTLASEIGEMVMRIIATDARGIHHCCGGQGTSRLGLARETAHAFGLDASLIRAGPPDPADPASLAGIPVPEDTRLRSAYTAEQLDYQPLDLGPALDKLRKQITSHRL
jgi:dTDP-4-dehydrorhamnose reductase